MTEAEVFQEGHTFDINPLIYYRLGAGQHQLAKTLPKINLALFYQ